MENRTKKIIGANRHQDFAHIGNALTNNLHYRDALKLRQIGMRVIDRLITFKIQLLWMFVMN